jgi:membrane protein
MGDLLERMVAEGWVGRVQADVTIQARWGWAREGSDCWVLLVDPALIRLADVYRLFVFGGLGADNVPGAALLVGAELPAPTPLSLDTVALARRVETAVEAGLEQTLAAHFAAAQSEAAPSEAGQSPSLA